MCSRKYSNSRIFVIMYASAGIQISNEMCWENRNEVKLIVWKKEMKWYGGKSKRGEIDCVEEGRIEYGNEMEWGEIETR